MRFRMSVWIGAVLAMLTCTSIAFAQDPTGPTYGGSGADVDSQVQIGGQNATGTLPFTGSDLGLVVLTAVLLVVLGLVIRRLTLARNVVR